MPRLFTIVLMGLLILSAPPALADTNATLTEDRAAVQTVIQAQIDAFRAGDGGKAFSFASPQIRKQFQTAETFMHIVKHGYGPVYRPAHVTFEMFHRNGADTAIQKVLIQAQDGTLHMAVYAMVRQGDGTWRINGCSLTALKGSTI